MNEDRRTSIALDQILFYFFVKNLTKRRPQRRRFWSLIRFDKFDQLIFVLDEDLDLFFFVFLLQLIGRENVFFVGNDILRIAVRFIERVDH